MQNLFHLISFHFTFIYYPNFLENETGGENAVLYVDGMQQFMLLTINGGHY